jgi:hypothetical protein
MAMTLSVQSTTAYQHTGGLNKVMDVCCRSFRNNIMRRVYIVNDKGTSHEASTLQGMLRQQAHSAMWMLAISKHVPVCVICRACCAAPAIFRGNILQHMSAMHLAAYLAGYDTVACYVVAAYVLPSPAGPSTCCCFKAGTAASGNSFPQI